MGSCFHPGAICYVLSQHLPPSCASSPLLSVHCTQQREELVAEVMSLKDAMEAMRERDDAIAVWKQQLAEQAAYLDSLMVRHLKL